MYIAFRDQDLSDIASKLSSINYKWIIVSMICGVLAIISRGLRWVFLIESLGYNISKKNSIHTVAIGYFTNILIPRAGEITRCTSLQQVEGVPFNKLFGTLILERLIDLAILILLVLVAFLYKFSEISTFFTEVLGSSSNDIFYSPIVIMLLIIILLTTTIWLLRDQLNKLSYYKKIKHILIGLKDGLTSLKGISKKIPFILHTIFIWLMYIIMTYVCFFAIKETASLSFLDGVYMTIIGGLGMIVPSQAGIGSYHLAVKIGLTGIGIAVQPALLFAFSVHTAQTVMTIIFGIISSISLISIKKNEHV
jgi:hypothetical protein